MSCFPCFQNNQHVADKEQREQLPVAQPRELDTADDGAPKQEASAAAPPGDAAAAKKPAPAAAAADKKAEATEGGGDSNVKTFNFRELATATKHFKQESLIGESGFGKVFKGTLPDGQVVAVKRLDRTGGHDSKQFSVEVLKLTQLHHPNLLNLVGYCADGEQRLLVYEYTPNHSLQDNLFDLPEDKEPLAWLTRMKIASGVAQGLEYLHEKPKPPIIYRDLKSSSILLDENFSPKLSDYGLAKLEGGGNNSLLAPKTGYYAPEYEQTGELTLKSDVYSFGVVMLELLSGRRAMDPEKSTEEQSLVEWAQPIFRDPKRFPEIVDPLLKKAYPMRSLNQAVGVMAMCLQEESSVRPLFDDVIAALSFLAVETNEPLASSIPDPEPPPSNKTRGESSSSDDSDGESDRGSGRYDDERSDAEDGNGSDYSEYTDDDEGEGEEEEYEEEEEEEEYEEEDEEQEEPLRNKDDADDSSDGDSDKLSFCYSVNMRSNSISELHDGESPKSNLRLENSLK